MLCRNLLVVLLILVFIIGVNLKVTASHVPHQELTEDAGSGLLKGTDLVILGSELMETGQRLRKAYHSYSLVPRTWRVMAEEAEKGNVLGATLLGLTILPIDLALSRLYGSFLGSYRFGQAGDHLIAGSRAIPSEGAVVVAESGNNLRTCRRYGLFSNAFFFGGLSVAVVRLSQEENPSLIYEPIAVAAGCVLKLVSVHYAGSAGRRLEALAQSFPSDDQRQAMAEAGMSIQAYRSYTYWGYGIAALGITLAVAGKDDDTLIKAGVLTALGGWIISSPLAVSNIKSAAEKLDEVGDRLMYWKE